jgi:hypothetical protein
MTGGIEPFDTSERPTYTEEETNSLTVEDEVPGLSVTKASLGRQPAREFRCHVVATRPRNSPPRGGFGRS